MTRKEPTIREVIAGITDPKELDGAQEQLQRDGRLTPEVRNLIAVRRATLVTS
jgi:hypothetical protein